ncbi:hypothetical protein [Fictibacillus terranigra]|uniref:Group-specific protein n=1 Tax=Fictibacillus terranigra TaxID=3058424 RepID=A0ABT8E1N7_9BACL|nr:hypothetical protein [Fictibacillus sp. CENA-BCM004]MDN4071819.1 hypothetical protein [Fictibacillus sp. CENA-BCM004]
MNPSVQDKKLNKAVFHFIFPFLIKPDNEQALMNDLLDENYQHFNIEDKQLEQAFYGENQRVSHRNMEHYYLPFTSKILFPTRKEDRGFQRFSKSIDQKVSVVSEYFTLPFLLLSVDVIICPFGLGFLSLRTEIANNDLTYTEALEYAARFRVMEDRTTLDKKSQISYQGRTFNQVEHFIFETVAPMILPHFDKEGIKGSHFETLPYFIDERMYVQGFFSFEEGESIDESDIYRAGQLDGMDEKGQPFIGASSKRYLKGYIKEQTYCRWEPDTYYVTDRNSFCCLTNQQGEVLDSLISQMYGEYYYSLLLNLFHKIVLLKLANEYSQVKLESDREKVEDLIRSITRFSSEYFFLELASQTQGRELFVQLRKVFGTQELYDDVRNTLSSLFKYQSNFSSERNGYLLLILTVYTVVSGIYGMNLAIEDLKGDINWDKMAGYSLFESIALITAMSGLIIGILLGAKSIYNWVRKKRRVRQD